MNVLPSGPSRREPAGHPANRFDLRHSGANTELDEEHGGWKIIELIRVGQLCGGV